MADTPTFADALRALAADLDRIEAGAAPTPAELAAAPLLFDWGVTVLRFPALAGSVIGHPRLGDRPHVRTTAVFAAAGNMAWVRTQNRFYRLGARATGTGEAGHA